MYYSRPKKEKGYLRIRIAASILAVAAVFFIVNLIIKLMIQDTVITLSKNTASQAINDAVLDVLQSSEYDYSSFVEIVSDREGAVQSVSAKSDMVNRFKSEIGRAVLCRLQRNDTAEFTVPIGTLLDVGALYDRGPKINIRLKLYGEMTTSLESSFISVGINQTKHRISCRVSANIAVITPSFTTYTTVTGEYLISETVIIGKIPDSYTNVNGDDSGIIGQIFDYADIE